MSNNVEIWGDSIMKGIVWDGSAGRYRASQVKAAENAARRLGLSVKNFSRMGCTSTKGFLLMKKENPSQKDAGAAILEFGGNDCDFNWSAISADPKGIHNPNTLLNVFEGQVREMIAFLRGRGIRTILTTLVPNHAERYFSFITGKGLNGKNILSWLGDVHHIYRWHERYSRCIERVAREERCPLIDLREAFLGSWHYEELLCEDGIHPNERGYGLIEEVLFAEAGKILAI